MNCITVILICAPIVLAAAAPTLDGEANIISYKNKNYGKGNYDFSFETSNGISRNENGMLLYPGETKEEFVVNGSFSYIDPNGKKVIVHYTAGKNGFNSYIPRPTTSVPNLGGGGGGRPLLLATLLGK